MTTPPSEARGWREGMRKGRRVAAPIVALVLAMAPVLAPASGGAGGRAAADERPWFDGRDPHLALDFVAGTPSARADVFKSAFFGASLRYMLNRQVGLGLDYAFMDVGYYYPESSAGPWAGPLPWSSVPDRYGGMKDSWIFYHTKHFISPQAWYVASLGELELPLALTVSGGPAISFLVPNEAAEFYPGLSDAFSVFKESFEAYLGFALKLGLEFRPFDYMRVGAEYLFIVDSFTGMASEIGRLGVDYFRRAGNLAIFTGVRL